MTIFSQTVTAQRPYWRSVVIWAHYGNGAPFTAHRAHLTHTHTADCSVQSTVLCRCFALAVRACAHLVPSFPLTPLTHRTRPLDAVYCILSSVWDLLRFCPITCYQLCGWVLDQFSKCYHRSLAGCDERFQTLKNKTSHSYFIKNAIRVVRCSPLKHLFSFDLLQSDSCRCHKSRNKGRHHKTRMKSWVDSCQCLINYIGKTSKVETLLIYYSIPCTALA